MKKEKKLNIMFWGLCVVEIILNILYFVLYYSYAVNYHCMFDGSISSESLSRVVLIIIMFLSLLLLIISIAYYLKNKSKYSKLYILIIVLINPLIINMISSIFLSLLGTSWLEIFNPEGARMVC